MQSRLNPYLSFRDDARDAMEFYHSVFGGTLQMNTFAEFGASSGAAEDDKIMHAMLEADNGITFMASALLVRAIDMPSANGAYVHDRRDGERRELWEAELDVLGRHELEAVTLEVHGLEPDRHLEPAADRARRGRGDRGHVHHQGVGRQRGGGAFVVWLGIPDRRNRQLSFRRCRSSPSCGICRTAR